MTAMAVSALMAGGMGGCQGDFSAQAPEMENVVSDIKAQAAEELRKAFSQEVSDFFKSDDLSKTLGDDGEGQAKLEESIRSERGDCLCNSSWRAGRHHCAGRQGA